MLNQSENNASKWTENERQKIIAVLQKDVRFQQENSIHLQKLHEELNTLQAMFENKIIGNEGCCALCRIKFGFIWNRGAYCSKCEARVCMKCLIRQDDSTYACTLCYKFREWLCASGEWFYRCQEQIQFSEQSDTVSTELRAHMRISNGVPHQAMISRQLLANLQKMCREQWAPVDTTGTISISQSPRSLKEVFDQVRLRTKGGKKQSKEVNKVVPEEPQKPTVAVTAAAADEKTPRWLNVEFSPSQQHESYERQKAPNLQPVDSILLSNQKELKAESQPKLPEPVGATFKAKAGNRPKSEIVAHDTKDSTSNWIDENKSRPTSVRNLSSLLTEVDTNLDALENSSGKLGKNLFEQALSSENSASGAIKYSLEEDDTIAPLPLSRELDMQLASSSNLSDFVRDSNGYNGSSTIGFGRPLSETRKISGSCSSLASMYSGVGEEFLSEVSGEIQLQLHYDNKSATLEIHVLQCQELKTADSKKKSTNPYVKTYLLPDRSLQGKRKTRHKRGTLNPAFNEILTYTNITKSEIEKRQLLVSVWHRGNLGRNVHLGETKIALADYAWKSVADWYPLLPKQAEEQPVEEPQKGELRVAVKFVPESGGSGAQQGKLQVTVKSARNLQAVHSDGTSNPFVKCYFLPDNKKVTKQRTSVIKKSLTPTWNHTFSYEQVTLSDLQKRSIELTIWNSDRFKAHEFLGACRLELGNRNDETHKLWNAMLQKPNGSAETWIPLRNKVKNDDKA